MNKHIEDPIEIYLDEDLPLGWIRVSDGIETVYGPADKILTVLKEFADKPPDSNDWPEELIRFVALEEGSANDNPNTLIILDCNGGKRYVAGPHGASYCALSDWYDTGEPLAKSRKAAVRFGTEG